MRCYDLQRLDIQCKHLTANYTNTQHHVYILQDAEFHLLATAVTDYISGLLKCGEESSFLKIMRMHPSTKESLMYQGDAVSL